MTTAVGNLSAAQASIAINTDINPAQSISNPAGAVGINILGTFVATAVFEASTDGANWFAVGAYPLLASGIYAPPVLSTTAVGTFFIPVYGYNQVRVRLSAYTSGTLQALLDVATSQSIGMVYANTEGIKPSYAASSSFAVVASPTSIAGLKGSATKTVRITRVRVSMTTATAAQDVDIQLTLRSGGTQSAFSNNLTAAPLDSNDAAATAVAGNYTSNPASQGTSVGVIAADRYFSSLTGTPALSPPTLVYDWGNRPSRCPVLRGTTQFLTVDVNGGAANAGSGDVTFEWTEE